MSEEAKDDDMSAKFCEAELSRQKLQTSNMASSDPKYQEQVQSALVKFMAVHKWVSQVRTREIDGRAHVFASQASVFSSNEELEDLSTGVTRIYY